jgi:hypothetical protein
MKMRRGTKLFLAGFAVVIIVLVILSTPNNEPTYQGKPLSYWVNCLPVTIPGPTNGMGTAHTVVMRGQQYGVKAGQDPKQAVQAITEIGTNALPYLMRRLGKEDSFIKNRIADLVHQLNWSQRIRIRSAEGQSYQVMTALRILGTNGISAKPELARMSTNGNIRAKVRSLWLLKHLDVASKRAGLEEEK